VDRERALDLARLLQPLDLLWADVEEEQAAAGGLDEPVALGAAEQFAVAQREEVLLLGRDEVRAVEREQRLAAPDAVALGAHVQALHPAADLQADGRAAALVGLEGAGGAEAP